MKENYETKRTFVLSEADAEKEAKDAKIKKLQRLSSLASACLLESENNAESREFADNTEEARKIIGEIFFRLNEYIPTSDLDLDLPIVQAYNAAEVLKNNFNAHNEEDRAELKSIIQLLIKAEMEESRGKKGQQ